MPSQPRKWLVLVLIAFVLCVASRPALVGRIADGRQMIFTAVAIAETGSLGQARSRDLTVPRPEGDSVSRYGLAMSLVQVPAAAVAPMIEARRGPGSSQWVFLVAPFVLVLACAILAARAARELGGGPGAQRIALLLSAIASPFGVYATMEISESLQAFALIGAFTAALRVAAPSASRHARSQAWLAGMFVGLAILTKSSLLAVAPLTVTPLLLVPRERAAKTANALIAGLVPIVALWLYFEIARFGRPFAGYAGEGFTHPFLDGAWRLLVGPNKGLLLYFPATLVACVALIRASRVDRARAIALAGAVAPTAALWMLAAPWWAWHGVDGWGPRLLVPGIPLLAVAAALELERWRMPWRTAFVAICLAVNVPPLLQHPTPVVRYMWASAWPAADAEMAARVPPFARPEMGGRVVIPPDQVLAAVPSASPFILLPWFFAATHSDPQTMTARLNAPPWIDVRPDIRPAPPLSAEDAATIAHPTFAVYDAALVDQILRAQQLRQRDRALELSRKLEALAPSGFADALLLESYRLLGRKADAIDWLTNLPIERREHPAINVVLALWDRDDGKEEEARALLQSSAPSYPGAPVQRALERPLSAWPSDFAAMTADPRLEVR
jgi:hypothetical protein